MHRAAGPAKARRSIKPRDRRPAGHRPVHRPFVYGPAMITVTVQGGPADGRSFDLAALECEEGVRKEIAGAIYALHQQGDQWIAVPVRS